MLHQHINLHQLLNDKVQKTKLSFINLIFLWIYLELDWIGIDVNILTCQKSYVLDLQETFFACIICGLNFNGVLLLGLQVCNGFDARVSTKLYICYILPTFQNNIVSGDIIAIRFRFLKI